MFEPLPLLLQMLALEALAEFTAVNLGPLLVERPVLAPVEVQLRPILLPRRYYRVHMDVPAVAMDGVDDVRLRERLALMLRDHLLDLLVARVFVKGVD